MSPRMRRVLQLTAVALLLIVAANVAVLWGVSRNRAGEPKAELLLTGREFYPWLHQKAENSGRFLRLRYQEIRNKGADDSWTSNPWLNREKLQSLGYRLPPEGASAEDSVYVPRFPKKKVFVVLELQGQAYEQALAQATAAVAAQRRAEKWEAWRDAERQLRQLRDEDSRLFLVDAGLDAQELLQRYPKRDQYIIVPGQAKIRWNSRRAAGEPRFYSWISIERDEIFVPLEFSAAFAGLVQQAQARKDGRPLQFQAHLAFGQKLEPWIKELRAGQEKP